MVVKMVSYKEMYLEKKRQLEKLESNSIDEKHYFRKNRCKGEKKR
jgi:hypothetical protein